jgi:hypothetical protein
VDAGRVLGMSKTQPTPPQHIIRCSECGRNLIVKDSVNNGVAFLSHLQIDHGITYYAQRMTETKVLKRNSDNKQVTQELAHK